MTSEKPFIKRLVEGEKHFLAHLKQTTWFSFFNFCASLKNRFAYVFCFKQYRQINHSFDYYRKIHLIVVMMGQEYLNQVLIWLL